MSEQDQQEVKLGLRFWARVDRSADCWIWQGYCLPNGYGQLSVNDKKRYAHRVAWELHHGPIPDGLLVCHHCDNPPCVNPEHLFLGTSKDNMVDARAKGRLATGERHSSRTHPERVVRGANHPFHINPLLAPRGDDHYTRRNPELVRRGEKAGGAKLSSDQVQEIRRLLGHGVLQRIVAERFGLTQQTVSDIATRRNWKHVEDDTKAASYAGA